ncbi:MAG: DUF58 domain-containing protein [Rudaea sp.]
MNSGKSNSTTGQPLRWPRVVAFAERRLPALTRLKQPEALPIRLDRRRIYVLPTRFGLMFSAVLLVMMLGALNYNNNPALLLTCLLGAAGYQSIFQAFRALNRLELRALQSNPCHAGERLLVRFRFHAGGRDRLGLRLDIGVENKLFDLRELHEQPIAIELPTLQRGWYRIGRVRVSSEYPFGLFHVWSWLNPQFAALIYPRLEAHPPPLPKTGAHTQETSVRRHGDELAALREYRPGDALRSIAWKASARHDYLLVKEFESQSGKQILLDFAALRGLDREARISRLASWVCMAESAQVSYAIHLPGQRIGYGRGSDHRAACLHALALLPGGGE